MILRQSKHNCKGTFDINADRVAHFKNRMAERSLSVDDVVVVLVNVDDIHGGPLADTLMPGCDWQQIRDQRQIPFARGLAGRQGIQEYLASFDQEVAAKLRIMSGIQRVVVVDHGVAEIFPA